MTETAKTSCEFRVNLDGMLLGDLERLDDPSIKIKEVLDILQRVLTGTDIRILPVSMLPVIRQAVIAKVMELANQKN